MAMELAELRRSVDRIAERLSRSEAEPE
jgi:hypothetical protein